MKTLITTLSSLLALVTPMAVAAETETSGSAAQPPVMVAMLAGLGTPTLAANTGAQPQVTLINLATTANIAGDSVTLGDLGRLPVEHPLAALVIAPAPLPGLRLCLSREQIELRLLRLGYRSGDVRLVGADSVVVARTGQMLRSDLLQAAVTKLIGLPVTVERLPQLGALPLGTLDYRLRSDLPNPLPDQFSLTLDVLVAGQVVARPTISLKLALPAAPPAPVDQTVNATRPTPATTPTTPASTRPAAPAAPAWQVKRGDHVAVTAVSGSVRIILSGEARGQGTLGDTIAFEVVLGGQKKTVSARIVAPDRAVMEV